jgi:2-(1,2-epoxy-1,2-dihydrophenyl)acetyl-CoA isomerase
MNDPVLSERQDGWVELVLNRPARRNALDLALAQGLAEAIEQLADDATVKVVLLRGAEGVFSSGLDLKAVQPAPGQAPPFPPLWDRVHQGLLRSQKIWICALERYAINGAASLAIAADWLVCGEGAFLQIGEIQLGMAAPRNLQWLAQRHTEAVAARLCLLGDRVPAPELFRLGIATEVVPDEQVLARSRQLAGAIAQYPAHGVVAVKSGLRAAFTRSA